MADININKIKHLIDLGYNALPSRADSNHTKAVLVIGDTGVGKSTIISHLAGKELVVKHNGLNTVLDTNDKTTLKIGHDKYSQTTVPTRVIISNIHFYDCSGFQDNRGDEF
jgi:ribosome biogenesis GTPase A